MANNSLTFVSSFLVIPSHAAFYIFEFIMHARNVGVDFKHPFTHLGLQTNTIGTNPSGK